MRVLFVVKEYLPKPTPPGLCVMNVRRALFSRGVQSDVLMVGDREGSYCSEPGRSAEVYPDPDPYAFHMARAFDETSSRLSKDDIQVER